MDFTQQLLRVTIAQICQHLGWDSINATPLAVLTEVLERYIRELAIQSHRYSELFGRVQPTLDDVGLAFQDLSISVSELSDYVRDFGSLPFALDVPKFPAVVSKTIVKLESDAGPSTSEQWNQPQELATEQGGDNIVKGDSEDGLRSNDDLVPGSVNSLAGAATPILDKRQPSYSSRSEAAPLAKKARLLPEEAAHSQYEMRSFVHEHGQYHAMGQGKLPDAARSPPPPPTPTGEDGDINHPFHRQSSRRSSLGAREDAEEMHTSRSKYSLNADSISSIKNKSKNDLKLRRSRNGVSTSPGRGRGGNKKRQSGGRLNELDEASFATEKTDLDAETTVDDVVPFSPGSAVTELTEELQEAHESRIQSYTDTIDDVIHRFRNTDDSAGEDVDIDDDNLEQEYGDDSVVDNMKDSEQLAVNRAMRDAHIYDSIDSVIAQSSETDMAACIDIDAMVTSPGDADVDDISVVVSSPGGSVADVIDDDRFFDLSGPVDSILEVCSTSLTTVDVETDAADVKQPVAEPGDENVTIVAQVSPVQSSPTPRRRGSRVQVKGRGRKSKKRMDETLSAEPAALSEELSVENEGSELIDPVSTNSSPSVTISKTPTEERPPLESPVWPKVSIEKLPLGNDYMRTSFSSSDANSPLTSHIPQVILDDSDSKEDGDYDSPNNMETIVDVPAEVEEVVEMQPALQRIRIEIGVDRVPTIKKDRHKKEKKRSSRDTSRDRDKDRHRDKDRDKSRDEYDQDRKSGSRDRDRVVNESERKGKKLKDIESGGRHAEREFDKKKRHEAEERERSRETKHREREREKERVREEMRREEELRKEREQDELRERKERERKAEQDRVDLWEKMMAAEKQREQEKAELARQAEIDRERELSRERNRQREAMLRVEKEEVEEQREHHKKKKRDREHRGREEEEKKVEDNGRHAIGERRKKSKDKRDKEKSRDKHRKRDKSSSKYDDLEPEESVHAPMTVPKLTLKFAGAPGSNVTSITVGASKSAPREQQEQLSAAAATTAGPLKLVISKSFSNSPNASVSTKIQPLSCHIQRSVSRSPSPSGKKHKHHHQKRSSAASTSLPPATRVALPSPMASTSPSLSSSSSRSRKESTSSLLIIAGADRPASPSLPKGRGTREFSNPPSSSSRSSSPVSSRSKSPPVLHHKPLAITSPTGSQSHAAVAPTPPVKQSSRKSLSAKTSTLPPLPPTSSERSASKGAQAAIAARKRMVITETVGKIVSENGEIIWICPKCKMPDDGSPMIGCDECDDWYHWSCLGITSEPTEPTWYCVNCIAKGCVAGVVAVGGPDRGKLKRSSGGGGRSKRGKKR